MLFIIGNYSEHYFVCCNSKPIWFHSYSQILIVERIILYHKRSKRKRVFFILFSLLGVHIFKNNASSYIQTPNHK